MQDAVPLILQLSRDLIEVVKDLLIQNQTVGFQNIREQPTYIDFEIMRCLFHRSHSIFHVVTYSDFMVPMTIATLVGGTSLCQ